MAELEQYSLRECAELIGFPEDTLGEKLENYVVEASEISKGNVEKRNLHTIHRLGNSTIVITKLVNWRDAIKKLQKRHSVNFLAVESKSLESLVLIKSGYLASAMPYSKRSKLNLFIQLMVR